MSKNFFFIALFLFSLFFNINLTFAIEYPQVESVSPQTLKPGDVLTLTGKNFSNPGTLLCRNVFNSEIQKYEQVNFEFQYNTVIGAYKTPKAPTSGTPDFRLQIISLTSNSIQTKIPTSVVNGDYNIGYNAETPKNTCAGYGDILVGFGKYDLIHIVGSTNQAAPAPPNSDLIQPQNNNQAISKDNESSSLETTNDEAKQTSDKTTADNKIDQQAFDEENTPKSTLNKFIQQIKNTFKNFFIKLFNRPK